MPKLFDIPADLQALGDLLDELGGEVTDVQVNAVIEQWYAECQTNESDKLEAMIGLICTRESQAAVAKAQKEQFAAKQQARENDVKRLKDRLKLYLEVTGRRRIDLPTGRVLAIQANGGKPSLLVDPVDHREVDPRFLRVTTSIDNESVRQAIEHGDPVPFARLGERGTQLRIK